VQAEYQTARAVAEEVLRLALAPEDPALLLLVHNVILGSSFHLGELDAAVTHAERGTTLLVTGQSTPFIAGECPAVICLGYCAWALWMTGFPDRARERVYEAVSLAREHHHHPGLAHALHMAAVLHWFRREARPAQECSEACIALCTEHGLNFWLAGGIILRGWALAAQGEGAEGVEEIRKGLAEWRSTGARTLLPFHLGLLAEALGGEGRTADALSSLAEALALADATGERVYDAELHRLRGELLLRQAAGAGGASPARAGAASPPDADPSPHAEVEACFRRALDVACRQGARSLELRSALSLARLLRGRGEGAEARRLLAETFGWFTEGWDTPDLREAREFLEESA
jgi:predicted ATPase